MATRETLASASTVVDRVIEVFSKKRFARAKTVGMDVFDEMQLSQESLLMNVTTESHLKEEGLNLEWDKKAAWRGWFSRCNQYKSTKVRFLQVSKLDQPQLLLTDETVEKITETLMIADGAIERLLNLCGIDDSTNQRVVSELTLPNRSRFLDKEAVEDRLEKLGLTVNKSEVSQIGGWLVNKIVSNL